jgi:antitoxin ParD1/3/4
MATLQITLDGQTGAVAEAQASAAGFGTVDDYVRALIQADERRRDAAALDRKLTDAIDEGEAAEMTAGDWEHIRSTVRDRLAAKAAR